MLTNKNPLTKEFYHNLVLSQFYHNLSHTYTHTQTHTQTDRQTDRQTERQTDRQTKNKDGQTDTQTDRDTKIQIELLEVTEACSRSKSKNLTEWCLLTLLQNVTRLVQRRYENCGNTKRILY